MARTLDVYFHNDLAGHLVQEDGGGIAFGYAESWLNTPARFRCRNRFRCGPSGLRLGVRLARAMRRAVSR